MKIGTKSLLFGVHQFLIHPFFVFGGWVKLYGWPNWKTFVCIIIHDWGYWGCSDMDGKEGEIHPEWAANIVNKYLDGWENKDPNEYYYLCLLHSRFWAKKLGPPPSGLCWADKLGTALMPTWLWVFLARLSGELDEYISDPHYEIHGEKDPFKFFERYKNELVPQLLKKNIGYE